MTKVKATLLVSFVLALSAGVVLGFAAARRTGPPAQVTGKPAESHRSSWLSEQLSLTPAQNEQIRAIWQQVMSEQGRANSERRRALEKERDGALLGLLTPEQRQEYERLMQQYEARMAELGRERDRLRQDAIERTKQVLSEQQRIKYEQLLTERGRDHERDRDRDRRHDRGGRGHRGGNPATSPSPGSAPP